MVSETQLLAALRSIAQRGKGKTILATDYTVISQADTAVRSGAMTLVLSSANSTRPAPNVPSPVSDTLAPTEITNYTVTAAVGQLIHACDQSADRYDTASAIAGSGMTNYRFETSGGTLIQNVVAAAANIQAVPTTVNIGAGTSSVTVAGNDTTIVSSGADLSGTSDQIGFAYFSRTGDGKYTVKVNSMSGGSTYAQGGIMLRESTAAGAKYVCIMTFQTGNSAGVQMRARMTDNDSFYNTMSPVDAAGVNGPAWMQIERVDTVFTFRYSFDNITWHQLYTGSFALTTTLLWGEWLGANGGTTVTAVMRGGKLTAVAPVTYTQTTVSAVTSRAFATDVNGNATANTSNVTTTPLVTPPPPSGYIKWHPSHGIGAAITDGGTSMTTAKATWDQARTRDVFGFGQLQTYWGKLESTAGVYDFSSITTARDYLNNTTIASRFNTPKRLVLEIWWMAFGRSGIGDGTHPVPQYIIDNGWTKYDVPNGVWYADFSVAGCRTAFKAMITALAAAFDTDPWFELFCFSESALELVANYQDIALHCKSQFAHTNVACGHNFLGSPLPDTTDRDFLAVCDANGIGTGGPDILVAPDETNGQQAHRGAGFRTYPPNLWSGGTFDYGTTDHRGRIPNFLQRQVIWGPTDDALATYAASQKATHVSWWVDGSSPAAHDITSTTTAATNHPVYTGCPTSYGGICSVA